MERIEQGSPIFVSPVTLESFTGLYGLLLTCLLRPRNAFSFMLLTRLNAPSSTFSKKSQRFTDYSQRNTFLILSHYCSKSVLFNYEILQIRQTLRTTS